MQDRDDAAREAEFSSAEVVEAMPAAMPGFLPGFSTPFVFDPWNYRDTVAHNASDLRGFHVEATDGRIGKVESVNDAKDNGYLVVDTGPWIFGRTVVIPAGAVNHIGYEERVVYVDRTKEQVKSSPEVSAADLAEEQHRDKLHAYYRGTYGS
jgi:hypothetical protein